MVAAVLSATAEELGRVGYGAMRIEAVAQRSGVNKTTIYRRWPNKPELVAAALRELAAYPDDIPDGRLRDQLIGHYRATRDWFQTPLGLGIARMIQIERGREPDLDAILREKRANHRNVRAEIVADGVERGELPPDTDPELLSELMSSVIINRLIHYREPVTDAFIERVVDVVLAGARETYGAPQG
ncbi:MAG: TetR/AcrR family transcriptional regulator [Deltaproteobacteria bacterium]|nr:TetR/AcrR family transcriptional regulator [Deltaproteobacteria bacterium]